MADASDEKRTGKVELTAFQKLMWRESLREQTKGLSPEEKKAVTQRETEALKAITGEELAAEARKYQLMWDALSPRRQEKLKEKAAERRRQRQAQRAAAG
jgi:hypothetical protein